MRDVRSQYSENVMKHFRNPRNVGEIEYPHCVGHAGNPVYGDIVELPIKDGIVVDAKFKTRGR